MLAPVTAVPMLPARPLKPEVNELMLSIILEGKNDVDVVKEVPNDEAVWLVLELAATLLAVDVLVPVRVNDSIS